MNSHIRTAKRSRSYLSHDVMTRACFRIFSYRFTRSIRLVLREKRSTCQWRLRSAHSWISSFIPLLLLIGATCSPNTNSTSILNPAKVANVVVGQSSRADVFAALGRPRRTERSSLGESWIYEYKNDAAGQRGVLQGAAAVSGVIGAFVPYAGLVGSGLGLTGNAIDQTPRVETTTLAVEFGADGVVRDCVYSSTALPAGVAGTAPVAPIDCQRPPATGNG